MMYKGVRGPKYYEIQCLLKLLIEARPGSKAVIITVVKAACVSFLGNKWLEMPGQLAKGATVSIC